MNAMSRVALDMAAAMAAFLAAACLNTEFLEGARCTRDDDCGRSLSCEGGVCGGCPEDARGPDGRCACPGNRVLECGPVTGDDPCVAVCASAIDLCGVAVRREDGTYEDLVACDDASAGEACFRVQLEAAACSPGEAAVVLEPAPPQPPDLLVNCPPPQSEDGRFDCP